MKRVILSWACVALVGVGVAGCAGASPLPGGASTPTDTATTPTTAGGAKASASGQLTSVDKDTIVIGLPDGSTRTFVVLPEDIENLNISDLATKVSAGASVRIFYETLGGIDYAVAVQSLGI
jgi:hypothetical protein